VAALRKVEEQSLEPLDQVAAVASLILKHRLEHLDLVVYKMRDSKSFADNSFALSPRHG